MKGYLVVRTYSVESEFEYFDSLETLLNHFCINSIKDIFHCDNYISDVFEIINSWSSCDFE